MPCRLAGRAFQATGQA